MTADLSLTIYRRRITISKGTVSITVNHSVLIIKMEDLRSTENGTFLFNGPTEKYSRPVIVLVLELSSLFIIMISAFIANVTAISIILRVRSLRRIPHNLLILTLSMGDLGVVFTSMPFSAVSSLDGGEFLRTHQGVCNFNGFCVLLFSLANFMTIVAIAMDRVFIVTSAKILQNGRLRVGIMIIFLWSFSTAVALLPVTEIVSTMIYVHYTRHCTYKDDEEDDERFRIAMRTIIIGFVLPALTVCYSIIAYFLWKQKQKLRALQQSGRRQHEKRTGLMDGEKMNTSSSTTMTTADASLQSDNGPSVAAGTASVTDHTDTTCIPPDKAVVAEASSSTCEALDHKALPGSEGIALGEDQPIGNQEGVHKASSMTVLKADESGRHCKAVDVVKRDKKNLEVQKRVALIGFLLVLSQIICWGPFFLVRAMSADVPEGVGVFTMWSAYCVNIINPLIYAFMNQRARKELVTYKNVLKKKLFCKRG